MLLKNRKNFKFAFRRLWIFLLLTVLMLKFTLNAVAIESPKKLDLTGSSNHKPNLSTSALLKASEKETSDIDVKVILTDTSLDPGNKQASTPTFVLPKSKGEELEFYVFLNVTNKTNETINFARYGESGVSNLIGSDGRIRRYETQVLWVPMPLALEPIKQIEAGKSVNILLAKGIVIWSDNQNDSQRVLIISSLLNTYEIFLQADPGEYKIQFFYRNTEDLIFEAASNIPFTITESQPGQQRKPHPTIEYTRKAWKGSFVTEPTMFMLVDQDSLPK